MAGVMQVFALFLFVSALCGRAEAAMLMTHVYAQWVRDLRAEAVAAGVREETLDRSLEGLMPDPIVEKLDQKQPEKSISFDQYLKNVVTAERVQRGRALLKQHKAILTKISARYGVAPEVIVSLWGIESSFGRNQGNFNVIRSLLTLAYEGRRAEFFRKELLNALRIMDSRNGTERELRGSWAGALGQCQFMPSTYLNHAVDGDGDGVRDIWDNEHDIFASIANYLAAEGWKSGQGWGYEVSAPEQVQQDMVGLEFLRPITDWRQIGVLKKNDTALPLDGLGYALVAPDGVGGRTFLVSDNFKALMRWNRSTYFGVAVGIMADRIRQ